MKKAMGMLVLGLAVGGGAIAQKGDSKTTPPPQKEPFYRRYLIAGNPLDERIREQEKLVETNPSSAALHNDFGNLLAQRRFPKEAREQYQIAMKLDKKNFLAPYNLGILYDRMAQGTGYMEALGVGR